MGAIPARPGPILLPSVPYRIGPGRAETDFLATSELRDISRSGVALSTRIAVIETAASSSHTIASKCSAGRKKSRSTKRRVRAPKGSPEFGGTFGVLQECSAEMFT